MSKLAKAKEAAFNWAIACDMRRAIDRMLVSKWATEGLTRRETKHLSRALGHLSAAQDEVRLLQASLSERSKLNGDESPDYARARQVNQF